MLSFLPICWIVNASMKFVVGPLTASAIAGGLTGLHRQSFAVDPKSGEADPFYRMTWNEPSVASLATWAGLRNGDGFWNGRWLRHVHAVLFQTLLKLVGTSKLSIAGIVFNFDLRQILVATGWIAVVTFIVKSQSCQPIRTHLVRGLSVDRGSVGDCRSAWHGKGFSLIRTSLADRKVSLAEANHIRQITH